MAKKMIAVSDRIDKYQDCLFDKDQVDNCRWSFYLQSLTLNLALIRMMNDHVHSRYLNEVL